jgi:HEAT repeat protein
MQKTKIVLGFVLIILSAKDTLALSKRSQAILHSEDSNKGQKIKWETAIRDLGDPQKGDALHLIKKILTVIDRAKSTGDESDKNLVFNMLLEHVKKHEDPNVRRGCVYCLMAFGKDAAEVIKFVLHSDENRRVRVTAARILGRVGGEEALDSLYSAIVKDKGVFMQGRNIASAAVFAIGEIGGERASEILAKVWQEKLYRGEDTLNAIGTAGHVSALPFIEKMLKGKQEIYRDNAVYALGQIASRNRDDLEIVQKVRAHLINSLRDKNPRVRRNAAYSLSLVGEPSDIPLLEELLEDSYRTIVGYTEDGQEKTKYVYRVREKAREAIEKINKRFPPEKRVMTESNTSFSEKPVIVDTNETDVNETMEPNLPVVSVMPFRTYTLITFGVVIAVAGAIIFLKKKAASRSK